MSFRALIIAIESYAQVEDASFAPTLPGTLQSALDFQDWLTNKWDKERVPAADRQIVFCSNPVQPAQRDATYGSIKRALVDLADAGQNTTKELYVYFSGHGFSYIRSDGSSDILIASDFVKRSISGDVCLNLDQVVEWLRVHLGPGRHYYFVDACRTRLTPAQIVPGKLTLVRDPQTSGEATTFVLQSTGRGGAAAADDRFAKELLAGLKGKGKAKVWDDEAPDTMVVRFDYLFAQLRDTFKPQKIYSSVNGSEASMDGILDTLRPAPTSSCVVQIEGGDDADEGIVTFVGKRNQKPLEIEIAGQSATVDLKPDRYTITLQMPEPFGTTAQSVDLYDNVTLTFQLSADAAPTAADKVPSEIIMPEGVTVELEDYLTGSAIEFPRSDRTNIQSGRYRATVRDNQNRVIQQKDIEIKGPESAVFDVTGWRQSPPHAAIANFFPQYNGGVDFSESLGGPVTDPDLDIWLAIAGGGRILGTAGDYSKIERLPLRSFADEPAGSSRTYVLAGFDDPSSHFEVRAAQTRTSWRTATEPEGMPGIKEGYLKTQPGPRLISLRLNGGRPYSIASFASPNRTTLITVSLGPDQEFRIGQFLLPMSHLVDELDQAVADRLRTRNQLLDVLRLARLVRAFRSRRDISKEVSDYELNDLLYAKWLDPISTALAAYELIRRGKMDALNEVVRNMKQYFPNFPDTNAIAGLRTGGNGRYIGAPLFRDGLRGFTHADAKLPLPEAQLDYRSVWTAWRGVAT